MRLCLSLLAFVVAGSVSAAVLRSDLKSVQKRIEKTKDELRDLRQSEKDVQQIRRELETELIHQEREFRSQFSKIIAPLLHWPPYSLTSRVKNWIEREHGRIVLEEVKGRMIKEPLVLISEREANLQKVNRVQSELETKIRSLENREAFLNLQLEELRILQKQVPIKKPKAN